MSISNNEIFQRLQQLGLNPPTINNRNRMFGLALIYNAEMEEDKQEEDKQDEEVASDYDRMDHEHPLYKDPRREWYSPLFYVELNVA